MGGDSRSNTRPLTKFEFQVNKNFVLIFLVLACLKYCMGHTYSKKLFIIYLKFKYNWESVFVFSELANLILRSY